ncbi:MAG: bifunctional phosphoribosylaminoimidazolecarboxamide formyltransferase/IMP cyclohydrolase [Acidimicrobiales bacterium]
MRALLSVYDKEGLVELAAGLAELGWELVASGGTAGALAQAGIAHRSVEEVTGAPEMLGGRVKTLHPAIHGGILADRSDPTHRSALEAQGIEQVDLVVCNLYPFRERPGIETIDVGGPTMLRSAAKNHAHVGAVVDPADYQVVLDELRSSGALSPATRARLARAAFAHTAAYDAAIVAWFDSAAEAGPDGAGPSGALPPTLHLALERVGELRYGENPHQGAARYREIGATGWWDGATQLSGVALSYLNVFDADAAWRLVHTLDGEDPAVVVVKHANPCGAAVHSDPAAAARRAVACDPVSAFGGIVALRSPVTAEVATALAEGPQFDVIVAPYYEPEALDTLIARRKRTRIVKGSPPGPPGLSLRRVDAGYLAQGPDSVNMDETSWRVVTNAAPSAAQLVDLGFAWQLCAATVSNAVVIVYHGKAVGVGAGQQSRVDAAEIAVTKAGGRGVGGAAASDAFFPFRDGLDVVARAGVSAVIQPGGSVNDAEIIAAADEHGMAMVLTGERHFRH